MDAHVSAGRRRVQQGNGRQFRESGRRRAAAVSCDDAVSLRVAGAVSGNAAPSTVRGAREHASRPATSGAARVESAIAAMTIRYAAAACQTDLPNPRRREDMRANTDRMAEMVDAA